MTPDLSHISDGILNSDLHRTIVRYKKVAKHEILYERFDHLKCLEVSQKCKVKPEHPKKVETETGDF